MTANIIEENLTAQVDDNGNRNLLIDKIENHRTTEEAISSAQGTYKTKYVFNRKKRKTEGWEFYVKRKYGSGGWLSTKEPKDSYPVPLADYAMSNRLQYETVFAWWFPYTLKKRIAIISKIKSKYWKKTYKYGIQVTNNVKEANAIDQENGNKLWEEAMVM